MAAGTATAVIVNLDVVAIKAAVEGLYDGATDAWMISAIGPEAQQVLIVHVEGA